MNPNPTVPIVGELSSEPGRRCSAPTYVVAAAWTGVIFTGAIFGFFYAWVCSTMWGLDATDPRVAISAMQAMNDSVRNAVFFPAFFLTPFVLAVAAVLARREHHRRAAGLLAAAALVYLIGGLVLTMAVNVPMNEELAGVTVPTDAGGGSSDLDRLLRPLAALQPAAHRVQRDRTRSGGGGAVRPRPGRCQRRPLTESGRRSRTSARCRADG